MSAARHKDGGFMGMIKQDSRFRRENENELAQYSTTMLRSKTTLANPHR